VVAWQEGATRVLCRLTASEEQEAQEAIRHGDGDRVASICMSAERIAQAIGYERQAMEWHPEETTAARENIREAVEYLQERESEKKEKVQQSQNECIMALAREELKREAERMKNWEASVTVEEDDEYRRAFDEEAERLFPRKRQDEMTRRIVMNRERFERVTEARFRDTRPQESWKVQRESESSVSRGVHSQTSLVSGGFRVSGSQLGGFKI
jgi:hypothetical protein